MSKWSEFQSIIQISIALNAAYSSVAQFVNLDALKERNLVARAIKAASEYQKTDIVNQFRELDRQLVAQQEEGSTFVKGVRYFSVAAFVVGLVLLWFSSIWASNDVGPWMNIVSALLNAPFTVGVLYMILRPSAKFAHIATQRAQLESDLNSAIATPKPTVDTARLETQPAPSAPTATESNDKPSGKNG